jgi:hypothetical protein
MPSWEPVMDRSADRWIGWMATECQDRWPSPAPHGFQVGGARRVPPVRAQQGSHLGQLSFAADEARYLRRQIVQQPRIVHRPQRRGDRWQALSAPCVTAAIRATRYPPARLQSGRLHCYGCPPRAALRPRSATHATPAPAALRPPRPQTPPARQTPRRHTSAARAPDSAGQPSTATLRPAPPAGL